MEADAHMKPLPLRIWNVTPTDMESLPRRLHWGSGGLPIPSTACMQIKKKKKKKHDKWTQHSRKQKKRAEMTPSGSLHFFHQHASRLFCSEIMWGLKAGVEERDNVVKGGNWITVCVRNMLLLWRK